MPEYRGRQGGRHCFDDCTGRVIGAALAVHCALGPGFLESIYQRALECELAVRGIRFESQVAVPVCYRGEAIGLHRLDLVVDRAIVVELKSVGALLDAHLAQLRSYLRAPELRLGLLLNFNASVLGIRRVVN